MEVPLDLRQIGYVLKASFGSPETSKVGNHYQHIFKLAKAMPSFTLEQGFQDIGTYAQYAGCKVSKIGLSFGGELTVPVTIMGIKETLADAYIDDAAPLFPEEKLNFDNVALKEDSLPEKN